MAIRDSSGQALLWNDEFLSKQCRLCGQIKPLTEFYRHTADTSKAKRTECRECSRERQRRYNDRIRATRPKETERRCIQCREVKPLDQFWLRKRRCKPCHNAMHRRKSRDWTLRKHFGITEAEFRAMHAAQDGRCAICRKPETSKRNGKAKELAVDHCHRTGKNRGLLCTNCNQGLGRFLDDVSLLKAAIAYLDAHNP